MNDRLQRVHASRSAAVKAGLDYPGDRHRRARQRLRTRARGLCGAVRRQQAVDALRKALGGRFVTRIGGGKDWYQQSAEERRFHRTAARALVGPRHAQHLRPRHLHPARAAARAPRASRASDYSILFPNDVLSPAAGRQRR